MFLLSAILCLPVALDRDDSAADLVKQARAHAAGKEHGKALAALNEALRLDPKNVSALFLRGEVHGILDKQSEAVADYTRILKLDPSAVEALDLRGSAHFKAGRVVESAADFDGFIKARPEAFNGHWRRGISLYYAGRFEDGRKQFEGYEKVDTNDVENAVWHFLCVARKDGVEKARASILKIGMDRRVPMMAVYELFQGKTKPEDVLRAVEAGDPAAREKDFRLFYAHLYLGLWFEVSGDATKALKHLSAATEKPKVHPYMWDVARVHRDLLRARKPK